MSETNITGDVHGNVYSGNIGQLGDRHIQANTYVEGGQINNYYVPNPPCAILSPTQSPRPGAR